MSSSRGFPGVCQRFLRPMQAARRARAQKVRPTPRGYLTNLFDVADPGAELPRCSDHGETQAPLLHRLLDGAGFSRCQTATQSARVGLCVTPERRSRRLRRAHGGCYGDGESEGSLLPPVSDKSQAFALQQITGRAMHGHMSVSLNSTLCFNVLRPRAYLEGEGEEGGCAWTPPCLSAHMKHSKVFFANLSA